MKSVRLLGCVSVLGWGLCTCALNACGSKDQRPASVVSAGGAAGHAGRSGQSGGTHQAGQAGNNAGAAGDSEGGAAGETSAPATPLAVYPTELEVNAACDATPNNTELVIQNGGLLPLTITSASADSGYTVQTTLPLDIAPQASGALLVAPPKPKQSAAIGEASMGKLSFATNEPGSPTHAVTLTSTLFGAKLEFTDKDGVPLGSALALTYKSSTLCPDDVAYRVHNLGNVAFKLFGPTFPAHLGGITAGPSGLDVAPDGYAELRVGGNSAPGSVCSASGQLAFTVQGTFCGAVPTLSVNWPANAEASCTCSASTQ